MMDETGRQDRRLERAAELLGRGLVDTSIDLLRELLADDPAHAQAHAFLALALVAARRLHAAEYEAEQAIGLEPEDDIGHFAMSQVRVGQKRLDEAERHLEVARTLDPDDEDYARALAILHEQRGNLVEAQQLYEEALALAPEDVATLAAYGDFHLQRGNVAEAERLALEALELEPGHPGATVLMGSVHLGRGDVEAARDHALWALQSDANDRGALHLLTGVKAKENPFLGVWWRYSVWIETLGDTATIAVLVGAFFLTSLATLVCTDLDLPGVASAIRNVWLAVVVYSWVGPAWFQRALARELDAVRLRDDF